MEKLKKQGSALYKKYENKIELLNVKNLFNETETLIILSELIIIVNQMKQVDEIIRAHNKIGKKNYE